MKRILVVVDMQNDFTTGPLGNAECAAVIPKVAEVIKTGVYDRIIFTQDTHQSNYLDTQEGKRLPVVHCNRRNRRLGDCTCDPVRQHPFIPKNRSRRSVSRHLAVCSLASA